MGGKKEGFSLTFPRFPQKLKTRLNTSLVLYKHKHYSEVAMETWFISKPTSIENYTPQTLKTFTIHLTVKLFENKKIIKSCLKSYKLSMQQPQKQKSNIRFNIQKQPSSGVLRKGVLKICNKFTGEYPCESAILCVFFYKVAAYFQNTFYWQQLYRAASNYRTFQPSSYH